MKIAFHTLGCKVNKYEEMALSAQLSEKGFEIVTVLESPDIYVVNSCTVTAEASRKTRQTVRKFKKSSPNSVIVITGCMAQSFPDETAKIEGVDLVIGNTEYARFADILTNFLKTRNGKINVFEHKSDEPFTETPVASFEGRTRAFIKIEDGCNRFCSYCIIPYARGRVRSRNVENIKREVERLAQNGFCEIVLVGINLSAFGADSGETLCDAVEAASSVQGIKRVRLGSIEPDQIPDKVLEHLAANDKFCPQFHLSLQSGCDRTLKTMNRHYDTAFYKDLVDKIRRTFKNASITTDIMVGFAGETEEDFDASLKFAREIGFAKAHVFAYSRRKGTRAYDMKNQVENAVKEQRSAKMIAACNEAALKFHRSQVGLVEEVLFEREKNGVWEGYTRNYTKVLVSSSENLSHTICPVKITSAEIDYCLGELI